MTKQYTFYQEFADLYDIFKATHDIKRWSQQFADYLPTRGASSPRIIDLGCGTGASTVALRDLGAEVVGVDFSPAMLDVAKTNVPECRFEQADVRQLPSHLGVFDAAVSMGELLNHIEDTDDCLAALRSIRQVVAPGGVYVVDTNTYRAYQDFFTRSHVYERDGDMYVWQGTSPSVQPEGTHTFTMSAFTRADGGYVRRDFHQQQRHYSHDTMMLLAKEAGWDIADFYGHRVGKVFRPADEYDQTKITYILRNPQD